MANDMMEAYLYEMNTLLESLDEMVLGAEDRKTFSQEDVNEIFRIMHTIKGSSAMMEFDNLMTVAHRIEDMFFIIRDKGMEAVAEELRPELFDLIFQAIDFFKAEVEKLENGETLTDDIDSILANIKSFSNKIQGRAEEEEPAAEAKAEPEAPAAGEAGGHASSKFPFGIRVFFDEGAGMENLRAFMLASAVRDSVESESDFDYYPADVDTNSETSAIVVDEGFSIRFLTDELRQKALAVVKDAGSVGNYNLFEYEAPEAQETQAAPQQAEPPKAQAAAPQSTPAAPAPAAQQGGNNNANKNQKESLISVNLSKLDELNAVVGEIVITESMVTASPDLEGLKLDNFTSAARQLRSLTDQLQDVSMSLRMVSVSATFQKMRRIVRDMSKKLGKEVNLVLEGEETEIDKTIVDSISDPLMHIVRNSMDHGIEEDVQDRIAAGKDPVGRIVLSARHTGSEVIIEVIDDGQGADDEAILNKAMRQGLAVPGVDYSHKDILNFLLMPGFSTNVEVTEYSGRGVGMDGMTTTLKIPLTMAIMDGMEVSVGDSVFTVPINNIRSILKMTNGDVIHDSTKGETLRVMDNFYSVVRAKEFYQMEKGQDEIDDGIILWVESGDNSFCLFVDKLIGEQQVVVKPLPDYVNNYGIRNYGVTGCTILGNGDISIILDVASIYAASQAG